MYIVQSYTFAPGEPGAGTITIPAILKLEDFGIITNVTRNSIVYDPARGDGGATVSYDGGDTILTLEQSTTYCFPTDKLQIQVLSNSSTETAPVSVNVVNTGLDPVPVDIQGATLSLTANGVEVTNDEGNPIPVSGTVSTLSGLFIPEHDYISMSYTGTNLTQVIYKDGGSGGSTVATLTLSYDGNNNLISVTKS